jgi:PIN domain nuclease of toxin-antitoxin system
MIFLLDTCTFIWMSTDPNRLSSTARAAIADPANRRFLSAISVLELAIKTRLGKLTLHAPLERLIREGLQNGAIEELPVQIAHALAVEQLPPHHRDPFDRLLIAQATVEGIPLITDDAEIRKYQVAVIW